MLKWKVPQRVELRRVVVQWVMLRRVALRCLCPPLPLRVFVVWCGCGFAVSWCCGVVVSCVVVCGAVVLWCCVCLWCVPVFVRRCVSVSVSVCVRVLVCACPCPCLCVPVSVSGVRAPSPPSLVKPTSPAAQPPSPAQLPRPPSPPALCPARANAHGCLTRKVGIKTQRQRNLEEEGGVYRNEPDSVNNRVSGSDRPMGGG